MSETMSLNQKAYSVIKLLGKGKGGYSYVVTDGAGEYVLKQIHHEPCDYYTFGDKLASELQDYACLHRIGIRMPRMLDVDRDREGISSGGFGGQRGVQGGDSRSGQRVIPWPIQ